MVLVQDDHVIEQFSPYAPNPSLGDPILPRAANRRSSRLRSDLIDHVEIVEDMEIPNPKSIFDYKPSSPAAKEFEKLAKEIKAKVKD